MCLDPFRCVEMCLDPFRCVEMCLDRLGLLRCV